MKSIKNIAFANFIFVSILCAIALKAGVVYANVGVEPDNIEMVAASDSETKGNYTIVNEAPELVHVKVEAEDWFKSRLGKSGIPVEQWLHIDPMEFDLGPKESKKVEYVITPPDGQKGELAAMVFFSTPSQEGAFNITSRYGVSIYVAIKNTIKLDCDVKNIGVYRDVVDPKKETSLKDKRLIFFIEVENGGNVHIRPTGKIEITGEEGDKYEVNIERGFPVYPGKNLSYSIPWDKTDVAAGKYNANIMLDCGKIYSIDKKIEKNIHFVVNDDGTISF